MKQRMEQENNSPYQWCICIWWPILILIRYLVTDIASMMIPPKKKTNYGTCYIPYKPNPRLLNVQKGAPDPRSSQNKAENNGMNVGIMVVNRWILIIK